MADPASSPFEVPEPPPTISPTPILQPQTIPFWQTPWEFVVHTIVGMSIFGIIAISAVFPEVGVIKLNEAYHVDRFIILGLNAAEYGVFLCDLVCFAVFLWRTARRTIKHL